jgi:L-methionine (R)-S-oxide reductase
VLQRIIGVFDLDNASVAGWNEADQRGLEKIAALVASACDWPF